MRNRNNRLRGMSLVEVIVATAVSAFVLTGLFSSLGSIYFSQKKISATQRFGSESRFIMERVVQLVRNNTLDYDRFFVERGPNTCGSFDENQVPDGASRSNNAVNREKLGYPTIFYWDVTDQAGLGQIRNLGGKKPGASAGDNDVNDDCAVAWEVGDPALKELYLINSERTQRLAIRRDDTPGNGRVELQRMLGADTNTDRVVDEWSFYTKWNPASGGSCELHRNAGLSDLIGPAYGIGAEKDCMEAYDWTPMSPKAIDVEAFDFVPTPNRDPYLNYRVDSAQVHPQVFVRMKTNIREPESYGLSHDDVVDMTLQTTASSRVFGDPRK